MKDVTETKFWDGRVMLADIIRNATELVLEISVPDIHVGRTCYFCRHRISGERMYKFRVEYENGIGTYCIDEKCYNLAKDDVSSFSNPLIDKSL